MEYPSGFSDETPYPLSLLERNFGEGLGGFLSRVSGEVPLAFKGDAVSGEALPFLLLLWGKGEANGFPDSYYALIGKLLKGEERGKLLQLLEALSSMAPPPVPSKPQVQKEDDRHEPKRKGEGGKKGGGGAGGAGGALLERIAELERQVEAQSLTLTHLAKALSRLQEDFQGLTGRFEEEVAVWGGHVTYINDELRGLKEDLSKLEAGVGKEVQEVRKGLQELSMQIQVLKRMIVPK